MTSRHEPRAVAVGLAVGVFGVLGVGSCGSEQPSGLTPFTPSTASGSASGTPSPASTSKWSADQQVVIDGYERFTEFRTAILSKTEKVDVARARQVAKEPYATDYLKRMDATLSAGFVQTGKVVNTISAVTITGSTATIKTCQDQTHTKLTNPGNPSAPTVKTLPPALATVSLVREGQAWLVAGFKGDEGACSTG